MHNELARRLMEIYKKSKCKQSNKGKNFRYAVHYLDIKQKPIHYFRQKHVIDLDSCMISKSPNEKMWIPELELREIDKDSLLSQTGWLTDSTVNAVQKLLKKQFHDVSGLQDICLGLVCNFSILKGEFIQILHSPAHWLTVSTVGLEHPHVAVFDSKYNTITTPVALQISSILCTSHKSIQLEFMDVQQQVCIMILNLPPNNLFPTSSRMVVVIVDCLLLLMQQHWHLDVYHIPCIMIKQG